MSWFMGMFTFKKCSFKRFYHTPCPYLRPRKLLTKAFELLMLKVYENLSSTDGVVNFNDHGTSEAFHRVE